MVGSRTSLLRTTTLIALAVLALGAVFFAGFTVGTGYNGTALGLVQAASLSIGHSESADPASSPEFGVFWETWRLLERDFYGDMPALQDRAYGAVRGLVSSMGDPHTAFLDPKMAAIVHSNDQGSFEGIGASIRYDDKIGRPRIVHVYDGQPAAKAGLRTGDIIVSVDKKSTESLSTLEVITLIRGPRGTSTTLSVLRQDADDPLDIPVTRDRIDIPVTEAKVLDNGIAYLKLSDFNNVATERVQSDLRTLLAEKPRGLILDLRGNPGGFLHVSVEIGSQFVGEGVIVTEKSKDGREDVFNVKPGGLATDKALPLIVLVDGGTASAAEIVAAAIRDSGRGVLIGEKTFGKTSVQVPHQLKDGSELRVTIARWFTPAGNQIKDGLSPDVEVKLTSDDIEADRDPQLDRAVQYLLNGK